MLTKSPRTGDFARQDLEHAHMSAFRLREQLRVLASLSSSIFSEDCGPRVAAEAVKILNVLGCSIQAADDESGRKTCFSHCENGLDPARMNQIASQLKAKVISAGVTVSIGNLPARYPNESWIQESGATKYLGVPLVTGQGDVIGAAAIFGTLSRNFNEDDEWFLQSAAQFVAATLGYESQARKMLDLERVLTPGANEESGEGPARNEGPKPTVLVIDDNRELNDLVCDVLSSDGYKVESAFNGVEAVQMFRPAHHSLAITDVAMPLMNGWELIAALRVRSPNLPIIVISGYSTGEWNPSYLAKQGVSAVLTKPLDLTKLSTLVAKLLPLEA